MVAAAPGTQKHTPQAQSKSIRNNRLGAPERSRLLECAWGESLGRLLRHDDPEEQVRDDPGQTTRYEQEDPDDPDQPDRKPEALSQATGNSGDNPMIARSVEPW